MTPVKTKEHNVKCSEIHHLTHLSSSGNPTHNKASPLMSLIHPILLLTIHKILDCDLKWQHSQQRDITSAFQQISSTVKYTSLTHLSSSCNPTRQNCVSIHCVFDSSHYASTTNLGLWPEMTLFITKGHNLHISSAPLGMLISSSRVIQLQNSKKPPFIPYQV